MILSYRLETPELFSSHVEAYIDAERPYRYE